MSCDIAITKKRNGFYFPIGDEAEIKDALNKAYGTIEWITPRIGAINDYCRFELDSTKNELVEAIAISVCSGTGHQGYSFFQATMCFCFEYKCRAHDFDQFLTNFIDKETDRCLKQSLNERIRRYR